MRAPANLASFLESVTLDASTAGARLMVTDSGTRLKYHKTASSPSSSDDSERFHLPMIFGTKGFTCGRHYWEVQVGLRNDWHVGVAKATVDRTGRVAVRKENGFFALKKIGFDYGVSRTLSTVLHLSPRPRNVGVYVDYMEGRVSFYDVTEKLHIYSFIEKSFEGKFFPYFYLYSKAKKSEALVINYFF